MRQENILKRVLAKEVLRQAFVSAGLFSGSGGDSVHGEFGDAADWTNIPPSLAQTGGTQTTEQMVGHWIQSNPGAITHICRVLLSYAAPQLQALHAAILAYAQVQLLAEVTATAGDPQLPQRSLSDVSQIAVFCQCSAFPLASATFFMNNLGTRTSGRRKMSSTVNLTSQLASLRLDPNHKGWPGSHRHRRRRLPAARERGY